MDTVYEEDFLNDQRRMWKYIVFGILTLGIYDLVFMHHLVKDLNKTCGLVESGEEDRSPEYIVVFLLSIVTLGIYSYVWYYKQGNRIRRAGSIYGLEIEEQGSTYLLWMLAGLLLLGVGPLIAVYLFISNINKLCRVYNYHLRNNAQIQEERVNNVISPQQVISENVWSTSAYYGTPEDFPTAGARGSGIIRCIKGALSGAEIELRPDSMMTVGRNSSICQLVLSEPDISRRHCTIQYSAVDGTYYVVDYSTFGIIMNDSQKLEKGVNTRCPAGTKLTLGNGSNAFLLQ